MNLEPSTVNPEPKTLESIDKHPFVGQQQHLSQLFPRREGRTMFGRLLFCCVPQEARGSLGLKVENTLGEETEVTVETASSTAGEYRR